MWCNGNATPLLHKTKEILFIKKRKDLPLIYLKILKKKIIKKEILKKKRFTFNLP
jgi:hypothetical protein